MARGYPDWYRGFEIFGGSVRLRVFPSYGAGQSALYNAKPAMGAYVPLISLSGQGIYYGGRIEITGTGYPVNDLMKILIDGNTLEEITLKDAVRYGKGMTEFCAVKSLLVDTANHIYTCDLRRDFAFESSFVLQYWSKLNVNTNVFVRIYYALAL